MSDNSIQTDPIKTAVIIGGHNFDVAGFRALLDGLPQVDYYIQDLENFVADEGRLRDQYQVTLFYNMPRGLPDGRTRSGQRIIDSLAAVVAAGQGIVLLHHAILAFLDWPWWSDLVGIPDRTLTRYDHDQTIPVQLVNRDHPITMGMSDWEIFDETYLMAGAGPDSNILLTTDHPKSMPTLAWTRQIEKSRVFCYQGGHDNHAFTDPNFQAILSRGVQWAAGRI